MVPLRRKSKQNISLIAGTPLEPYNYNVTRNGKRDSQKIVRIG